MIGSLVALPGPVLAQGASERPAFTGGHAGVEAGVIQDRFDLEVIAGGLTVASQEFRKVGLAAGGFVGHDWALSTSMRGGIEAGATFGGRESSTETLFGGRYAQRPRWGWRAVAKLGFVAGENTLIYGTAGIGGQRYRIEDDFGIEGAKRHRTGAALGLGIEQRLSPRAGVRLDGRYLTGSGIRQLLVGVPVRF